MKKIIFLFLMFSAIVFAKWEVEYSYTKSGDDLIVFVTTSLGSTNFSSIRVGVNVKYDYSTVLIESINIDEDDNIALIITDNEGNDIYCNFYPDDIEDYCVNVPSNRASVLTKMLYNGKSAVLKNRYTDETLAKFDLKGIKQVMQKHVGSSYWYEYKLND
mgnify:CR=1 FL=1